MSMRCWVDPRATVWPEGLSQWKIPMTLSGIEPATFWLEAQCLYQVCHCIPLLPWRHHYNNFSHPSKRLLMKMFTGQKVTTGNSTHAYRVAFPHCQGIFGVLWYFKILKFLCVYSTLSVRTCNDVLWNSGWKTAIHINYWNTQRLQCYLDISHDLVFCS